MYFLKNFFFHLFFRSQGMRGKWAVKNQFCFIFYIRDQDKKIEKKDSEKNITTNF